jgi:hypothetical protein
MSIFSVVQSELPHFAFALAEARRNVLLLQVWKFGAVAETDVLPCVKLAGRTSGGGQGYWQQP